MSTPSLRLAALLTASACAMAALASGPASAQGASAPATQMSGQADAQVSAPGAAQAADDSQGSGGVRIMGINDHPIWRAEEQIPSSVREISDLRAGSVRIDMPWNTLQPQPGQLDTTYLARLDKYVNALNERGVRILAVVRGTPAWANKSRGETVPADKASDYANFIGQLAGHYAGRVEAWEVWNEPSLPLFYTGTPRQYAQMLKAASRSIRAADPEALVVAAGPASVSERDMHWLRQLYVNGSHPYFDILSVHAYGDLASRRDFPASEYPVPPHKLLNALRAKLEPVFSQYKDHPRIWLTEAGLTSSAPGLGEADQSEYVSRLYADVIADRWLERAYLFTLRTCNGCSETERQYGLVEPASNDNGEGTRWHRKPAFVAFHEAADAFSHIDDAVIPDGDEME